VSRVRVLVVDDQEPFRRAAVAVVEATAEFVVAGVAATAEESIRLASALPVDLVLMDVNLPGIDGIEAAARIAELTDPPLVLLVSTYDEEELSDRLADATAAGYLPKARFGAEQLVRIWAELTGRPATGPAVG
jgi:DNA-binding NarL/FixJ family response regulator